MGRFAERGQLVVQRLGWARSPVGLARDGEDLGEAAAHAVHQNARVSDGAGVNVDAEKHVWQYDIRVTFSAAPTVGPNP